MMSAHVLTPDFKPEMTQNKSINDERLAAVSEWDLSEVVYGLRQSREYTKKIRYQGQVRELPSREVMQQILEGLAAALFPTHYGRPDLNDDSIDFFVGSTLHGTLTLLAEQVRRSLLFVADRSAKFDHNLKQISEEITRTREGIYSLTSIKRTAIKRLNQV